MKIVVDLQCCQTSAKDRGIGRYTSSLTKAVVKLGSRHDFLFLLNYKYLSESKQIIKEISDIGNAGDIIYYDYPSLVSDRPQREMREEIANILRSNRIETASPDLYHISSLFEGDSVFNAAAPYLNVPSKPVLTSATIYDLIPKVYPDQYLNNKLMANWYTSTMDVAKRIDIKLAISETTKRDAVKYLGVEEASVHNILGAVSDEFRILSDRETYSFRAREKLNLDAAYLMYVGGPDSRKNVSGMLHAFHEVKKTYASELKLLIVYDVDNHERRKLQREISDLRLQDSVVISGFVEDQELVELYNFCEIFVFPSHYEGFGLPIIEAMKCGAPVLVGDNSSQAEIVALRQYRFDSSSSNSIAGKILEHLQCSTKLEDLRRYSRKRANDFTWENSAAKVLEAWEEGHCRQSARRSYHASTIALTSRLDNPDKPKIAMFTPLPPAQTGIADYSADLIPHLTKYADMDLFVEDSCDVQFSCRGVRIHHHRTFKDLYANYNTVIYQLGNSPFHHYMLNYMSRYPGIVVLHDAYLGHLSNDPRTAINFVRQTIRDYGGKARKLVENLKQEERIVAEMISQFTCSAVHAHRSLGVIVHSHFARELIYKDSHPSVCAEIRVLPQYRAAVPCSQKISKIEARKKLNLPTDRFLVASFGHIASTKGILELIRGFLQTYCARSKSATLILVGQLEGYPNYITDYGKDVLDQIGGSEDILVTNFVDSETYGAYLSAIDIGVQFRTVTRGETSGAMLNLIANGIPFIYNRLGAASELPEELSICLDDTDPAGIASAIDSLFTSRDLMEKFSTEIAKFNRDYLDGDVIGRQFIAASREMTARSEDSQPAKVSNQIARSLKRGHISEGLLEETAQSFINQEFAEQPPRLLIDVSHIREIDLRTGVQRVVREIMRAAYVDEELSPRQPQAFAFSADGLVFADDYASAIGARCAFEKLDNRSGPLQIQPFDQMVLADGSWHWANWMREPLHQLNKMGGSAFALVHDILPLNFPHLFHSHVVDSIKIWLELMVKECDGLICTSKSGADDLISYIRSNLQDQIKPNLRIGWAHLGSNPSVVADPADVTNLGLEMISLLRRPNVFLMVGTIEPRKGHSTVLEAFEAVWDQDIDATLVFVGKRGWSVEPLIRKMDNHPEKGRRFFEMGFVSDASLVSLYKNCRAAIIASVAEGFGLPIFEAANFGAPLILSDIPVFRELAQRSAKFFEPGDSKALRDIIRSAILDGDHLLSSSALKPPLWEDFYKQLREFIDGRNVYFNFGQR